MIVFLLSFIMNTLPYAAIYYYMESLRNIPQCNDYKMKSVKILSESDLISDKWGRFSFVFSIFFLCDVNEKDFCLYFTNGKVIFNKKMTRLGLSLDMPKTLLQFHIIFISKPKWVENIPLLPYLLS